jgi:hypothetical protein
VIKEKTGEITLTTENIPDQLTERPQWVSWRLEVRKGEPTKVPYTRHEEQGFFGRPDDLEDIRRGSRGLRDIGAHSLRRPRLRLL